MRAGRWLPVVLAVGLCGVLPPSAALAQPEGAAEKTQREARERFDRGLRLFNQGDNAGALAEFTEAYALIPHPLVLFNLALVHVSMRRPVEAVDALERIVKQPGSLSADRLAKAQQLLAEQGALIGTLLVTTNVEGATIEMDQVEVATAPLSQPISVASGTHLVTVVAPGYQPTHRKISVAGQREVKLEFQLQQLQGRVAHLEIRTNVPDAEVSVDGTVMGRTPLVADLALAPGKHTVELSRPGYRTARQSVDLGDGAKGEVELGLQPDPARAAMESGMVALAISEPQAVVFVNGQPLGAYAGPLQLPRGKHLVRVERADFFPYEREVDVPQGRATELDIELQPTPEYRAFYADAASSQRFWGWTSVGAGGLFLAGSAGFLIWNSLEKSNREDEFDGTAEDFEDGGPCDPRGSLSASEDAACQARLDIALEDLEAARDRDVFGYIGLGVGAAAAGLGVYLLATGDDPDRYEPKAESDVFAGVPSVWVERDGGGLGWQGHF